MDRSSYITERNLTEVFKNLTNFNEDRLETTTEFINDMTTEGTTEAFQSSTIRPKRMNIVMNDIILTIPNAEENKYLWLPLTLLITGAVLSHLGENFSFLQIFKTKKSICHFSYI